MGILGRIFGTRKKIETDGLWLQAERESTWLKVGEIKSQDIELSKEGCYAAGSNTYFLLRSAISRNVAYSLCAVTGDTPDEILILCNRLEDAQGKTIVADDWAIKTISDQDGPFRDVIVKARNWAGFNAYKTAPSYMLYVALNANKSLGKELANQTQIDSMAEGMKLIRALVDDEDYQNSLLEPPIANEIMSGEALDEIAGAEGLFGFSARNPIPVNGRLGELSYLSRLRNPRGERLFFHRVGSIDLIDIYEAVSWSGKDWYVFYFDIYHPHRSRKPPQGFSISTDLGQFTGFYEACSEFPMDFVAKKRDSPFSLGYISIETATAALKAGAFVRPDKHRAALGAWAPNLGISIPHLAGNSTPNTSSNDDKKQALLKLLVAKGTDQGYLTFDDVHNRLPAPIATVELFKDVIGAVRKLGIPVYKNAPVETTADGDAGNTAFGPKEEMWAFALREYESAERRLGLYAKLFASFEGDEAKTKAAYIKARVSELTMESLVQPPMHKPGE